MNVNDVIEYICPEDKLLIILEESLEYAIKSIPFTVNRMGYKYGLHKRIENIVKGKMAEKIFIEFVKEKNIKNIDYKITQTKYYEVDKGDFLLKKYEWDIKNNFLTCEFEREDVIKFYALIPDRHKYDQWSKRKNILNIDKAPKGKAFLFTFMRRPKEGFIKVPKQILKILEEQVEEYEGKPQNSLPEDFEFVINSKLSKINIKNYINLSQIYLKILITGYATNKEFKLFEPLNENFVLYNSKRENCFQTRIKNKGCQISKLPSFKSLINNQ